MREGSVPGPRIGPHDPDALPGQKERRLLSHATSFVQEIGASIGCPRRRVHENDIERLQLVADTIELALHLRSRHDMAIRLCPEIQFDAGSNEQVQRRFIDRRRPPALGRRSEEHTSELQSIMRISYAVFCLKKKNT